MSPSHRVQVGPLSFAASLAPNPLPCRFRSRSKPRRSAAIVRRVVFVLLVTGLGLLFAPRVASAAAGTVTSQTPNPEEDNGRWRLSFNFDYGRVPDMPHIPMMFSFQHVVQYEWSLTDESPNKPIMIRKPLHNQPAINISTDVGFADASGKVWRSTKNYRLELRRDAEFEAGEYTLTIREGGRIFGRPIRLTLRGKNEPVDRRAINIEAPKPPPKKPKSEPAAEGEGAEEDGPIGDDLDSDHHHDSEFGEYDEPEGPPAEKPRQGGCGCALPGEQRRSGPALAAVLGLGLGLGLRGARRRAVRRAQRSSGAC